MIDSSLRFYVRVAKSGVSCGGVFRGEPRTIVDHPVMISICYKMLQNKYKRDFPKNLLASLLQRFSSGVLRRLL